MVEDVAGGKVLSELNEGFQLSQGYRSLSVVVQCICVTRKICYEEQRVKNFPR